MQNLQLVKIREVTNLIKYVIFKLFTSVFGLLQFSSIFHNWFSAIGTPYIRSKGLKILIINSNNYNTIIHNHNHSEAGYYQYCNKDNSSENISLQTLIT